MNLLIQEINQRKPHFVCKNTGHELLLIPLKDNVADFNQYLVLNELGAFVWEQIDGDCSWEALQAAIFNEFDAPLAQIAQDLAKFIPELHQYTRA
ncbi:MAG: PqqD family protein, partial [Flavobacteriia bacterium]